MKISHLSKAALTIAVLSVVSAANADVKLSKLFSDHMVLQRDANINVWGWASPGENISVKFDGQTVSAVADKDGNWSAKLAPMKVNAKPQTLTVTGNNKVEVTDILIGEVWLCAGQSNMGTGFTRREPALDPGQMDLPNLRYVGIPNTVALKPAEDAPGLNWTVSNSKTVPNYATVPWYFGQLVQQKTGIPIGIIKANWGGAVVDNWLAPDSMKDIPELNRLSIRFRDELKAYNDNLERNTKILEDWVKAETEAKAKGTEVPPIPSVELHPVYAPPFRNGFYCMYNGMVNYLTKLPIKGVTWYQGESSIDDGQLYYYKMLALINGWRNAWNEPNMPFYFVQLPNVYGASGLPEATAKGWQLFREVQAKCLSIPNTGMAVTIDVGDEDLHPRNKYDTGRRLAAIALAKDYGVKIEYTAPVFKKSEIKDNKVILTFDQIGSGLMVGKKDGTNPTIEDKQGSLQEFAIAGEDKRFVWATAIIEGDTVVVSSPDILKPVAVRYAFTMNPAKRNLYGKNGLPVAPFRTDNW